MFIFHGSFQLFHDGGSYHIKTSPLVSRVNPWTGFYIIGREDFPILNETLQLTLTFSLGAKHIAYFKLISPFFYFK